MKTAFLVKSLALLASACLLCGTLAYAQEEKSCVNYSQSCFGFDCYKLGGGTCTDSAKNKVNYNRLTQVGFVLGECQKGWGDCVAKNWDCTAQKFWNSNPTEQICNQDTHRCTDTGQRFGCKDS